jgi:uncharacterized membrane protein
MSIILLLIVAVAALYLIRRSEMRISVLERRVVELEARPALSVTPQAAPGELAMQQADDVTDTVLATSEPEMVEAGTPEETPSDIEQVEEAFVPQQPAGRPRRDNLESWIGARWPVWVGGLALGLGGILMVKYSIDNGLISPAVRLTMAALLGLVLLVFGEGVRRRVMPLDIPAIRNALIPGVLTAAGMVTLFGVVFAAYAIYDYIGPTAAFGLLAIIALCGIALSLLHGQALAGLGLLAAMITPALVSTDAPSAWSLFGYLSIAWFATAFASRIRGWNAVPAISNLLLMGWSIVFVMEEPDSGTWAMIAAQTVMIAGLAFVWPAGDGEEQVAQPLEEEVPGFRVWFRQIVSGMGHRWIKATGAFAVFSVALCILLFRSAPGLDSVPVVQFALLFAALGSWGAWRRSGLLPSGFALVGVLLGALYLFSDSLFDAGDQLETSKTLADQYLSGGVMAVIFALGAAFCSLGIVALWRHGNKAPAYWVAWSFIMWMAPLALLLLSFLNFGNFNFDWRHGLVALGYAAVFTGLAEWVWRRSIGGMWRDLHIGVLVTGSYLAAVLALHAMTQSVVTTILVAVAGFAYFMASRVRHWPILPWIMGFAGIVVLARIGWQPSLVGDLTLSKTPIFNQLLPGYGIPAILTGLAAYLLKDSPSARIRNFLQALASLLALMTVAILARHAMNGGVLSSNVPTLGEQSIYTLLSVGGSAVLMTLDMRSPSPVFRWGSMLIGGASMLFALFAHLSTLNPYVTGELTGTYPFFNLLLLGYLLPSLAFFGLAFYARGKRPLFYVRGLAVAGALLAFAWVTLTVRRFWQGPGLADWKGFQQGEMYSYSVVWLILGVLLLVAGSRFHAKSLRLASAALVLIDVLKVFLVDMSNLEGILRALSFIGLGAVLIGIGLFYQRILMRAPASAENGLPPNDRGGSPV